MQLLVESLLRKNQIPFERSELEFQIQSHPSYPSLHAVTGVLDHFGVTNVAARVPRTSETLDQLPDHFIAQMQGDSMNGLFVTDQQPYSMRLHGEDGAVRILSVADFISAFTGIVLAVEQSAEQGLLKPRRKRMSKAAVGILILLLGYIFVSTITSVWAPVMLVVALAGLVISVSIFQQESGVKNKIGEAFCDGVTQTTDCASVLHSPGARIFGVYKLSDLSMVYFTGFTIASFLLSVQGLGLDLLYMMGLLGVPVTIYSIYYQAFKLKKWCLLCLTIVGLLWIMGGVAIGVLSNTGSINWDFSVLLHLAISFTASVALWSYLKPNMEQAEASKRDKISYYKFKRNYSIFQALLKDQDAIDTAIPGLNEMVFGNPDSKVELVFVTNPFCGHCKPVHSIIEDLLSKYDQDIRLVIRFNIGSVDTDHDLFQIVAHLMHAYATQGAGPSLGAMHEIFQELKAKEWLEKWSVPNLDTGYYAQQLALQKHWCTENKLNFTPVVLVNGYSFPREYERGDLLFFIEDLVEESEMLPETSSAAV